jgi:radical SAM superfamily enzyme YgiQ (UPF0313 family)
MASPHGSIVVGEAEGLLKIVIEDMILGNLKAQYSRSIAGLIPYADLQKEYIAPDYSEFPAHIGGLAYGTEASRGCSQRCRFCSTVKAQGYKIRTRDISSLEEEISRVRNPFIEFVDNNLFVVNTAWSGAKRKTRRRISEKNRKVF